VDRWCTYQRANKLKRAALHVIANQLDVHMDSVDTRRLRDIFIALDTDGSGHMTREKLRDPLVMQSGLLLDGNFAMSYTEFIAAGIHGSKTIDEGACRTAFSLFDRDGDGKVSTDELAEVLDHGTLKYASAIAIKKVDSDNDGRISFGEFLPADDGSRPGREHAGLHVDKWRFLVGVRRAPRQHQGAPRRDRDRLQRAASQTLRSRN